MPRLQNMKDFNFGQFVFTAVRPDTLGEPEYTVVNIFTDSTGSVAGFSDQLLEMEKAIIKDAQKSSYGKRLIIRLNRFNSQNNSGNQSEVYGFREVKDINIDSDHQAFSPYGATPLVDTHYDGLNAVLEYCQELYRNDYMTNGLVIIIGDGLENASHRAEIDSVIELNKNAVKSEMLDSLKTIIIGVNTSEQVYDNYTSFPVNSGDTISNILNWYAGQFENCQYIDAGDVEEGTIGKIAGFISQSISSTSQALGTGSPSQNLTF